jgi:hypothetical protein
MLTRNRAWIHSITGKLKGKPLLDMVGGVIEDYEFLWDQYYGDAMKRLSSLPFWDLLW